MCSYQDILDHLNLTTDNSVFRLTRPVVDHTQLTRVELDIYLYAILAVVGALIGVQFLCYTQLMPSDIQDVCSQVEKTQTFIPFIWATVVSELRFSNSLRLLTWSETPLVVELTLIFTAEMEQ